MVKQVKTGESVPAGREKAGAKSRQDRLDAALRANLKRRKQQSRARSVSATSSEDVGADEVAAERARSNPKDV